MLKRIFAAILTVLVLFSTVIGVDTSFGNYYSQTFEDSFYFGTIGSTGLTFLAYYPLTSATAGIDNLGGKIITWRGREQTSATSFQAAGTVSYTSDGIFINSEDIANYDGSGNTSNVGFAYVFPATDGYSSQLDSTHIYYASFETVDEATPNSSYDKERYGAGSFFGPANGFHKSGSLAVSDYCINENALANQVSTYETTYGQYTRNVTKKSVRFSGACKDKGYTVNQYNNYNGVTVTADKADSIAFWCSNFTHGYGNHWLRNFIFIDLTQNYGKGNEPSLEWCEKYFNNSWTNITSAASLSLLDEERDSGMELEDGMIAGTQIDIMQMPKMTSINAMAAEEAPDGYEFYGWHIRSDFAQMTLSAEDAEFILEDVYASVDGEPYPLTLTAIYKEKPPDEPSPSPEVSPEASPEVTEEATPEASPEVSEEPSPDVSGDSEEILDIPIETTPTPTPSVETETTPTPDASPDNTITIDATEVTDITILEVADTFIKGEPLILTFTPDDNYQLPDTIELVIDGTEYLVPTSGESGYDSIFFEDGLLIISADFTADITELVIKAAGVSTSGGADSSPEVSTEPTPEATPEVSEEPSAEPSPEVTPEASEEPSAEPSPEESTEPDESLEDAADELLGSDAEQAIDLGTIEIDTAEEDSDNQGKTETVIIKEVLVATERKEEEAEESSDDDGSDTNTEIS